MSTTIHVTGLTRNIVNGHLAEIFGCFAPVRKVKIDIDPRANLPTGSASIVLDSVESAEVAVAHMDGGWIDGRKISVNVELLQRRQRRRSTSRSRSASESPDSVRAATSRSKREFVTQTGFSRPATDDFGRRRDTSSGLAHTSAESASADDARRRGARTSMDPAAGDTSDHAYPARAGSRGRDNGSARGRGSSRQRPDPDSAEVRSPEVRDFRRDFDEGGSGMDRQARGSAIHAESTASVTYGSRDRTSDRGSGRSGDLDNRQVGRGPDWSAGRHGGSRRWDDGGRGRRDPSREHREHRDRGEWGHRDVEQKGDLDFRQARGKTH